MIYQADITDPEQAQHVIAAVQRTMGPLRGIMHAAMVLDDAPIERLTEERMWKAMAPKIMGAWNLHALTAGIPLDFFVLFSSITSVIGNPGQANYGAGNAFLDALAYYRRARGLPALTVNWGFVGEVGHVANSPEAAERLYRRRITAMPISETLDALDELMSSNAVQVGVVQLEWKELLRSTLSRVPARFAGLLGETGAEEGHSTANSGVREILEADAAALPSLLETYMRDHLARAMQASPAQIDTQFSQGASVKTLAAYVAERLLEGDRRERSKTAVHGIAAEAGADIPVSGEDATDLLQRIDELTDEEVDRQLSVLAAQGHG